MLNRIALGDGTAHTDALNRAGKLRICFCVSYEQHLRQPPFGVQIPYGSVEMKFTATDLVPLKRVPEIAPGNPHYGTVSRWVSVGVRGVRLKTLEVGGHTFTSQTALQEFFDAVTAAKAANKKSSPAR
jgi:hypothetical protein